MGQVVAVVPAAGKGERMGAAGGKQFMDLLGLPVLVHTLKALAAADEIDVIVLVTGKDQIHKGWQVVRDYEIGKVKSVTAGGDSRQASVWAGLNKAASMGEFEIVVVHDAARPLIQSALVDKAVRAARKYGAVGVAVPVKDTIKVTDAAGFVISTPPRESLWAIQTPQVFQFEILWKAHTEALKKDIMGTDDCMLVEEVGKPVQLLEGSYENIKLTTQEDLILAEGLLSEKKSGKQSENKVVLTRVGIGYDIHQLVEGRQLILGGVTIPYGKGLLGHSDADVLVHAVIDALLGALARGDIGTHFPDTDAKWKGADSLGLLGLVQEQFFPGTSGDPSITHIDSLIIAERPKLAPYIDQMRNNIAKTLKIPGSRVSIKATTSEGLGPVGRQEGIAAQVTATVLA
ncbi:MAG: 2-C-methyl-D-erythritol 4-phosphate cytidylyltransferase [Firmicutes bacterium]|nr:2-C-methyl-D-erythritol 4-phosphate cytidylyltransferase [Bacillota bacterium]